MFETGLARDLEDLRPLIDRLAAAKYPHAGALGRWTATRVPRGRNNLVYRLDAGPLSVAVKFTIVDARDRAGREYGAMLAMAQAGLDIAPRPLGLIRDGLQHPAVVETWLAGPVSDEPPTIDGEWEQLVRHLAQIHRVTPESCAVSLPAAVLTMTGTVPGLAAVTAEVECLRPSGVPQEIAGLVRRMTAAPLPDVVGTAQCLCRCDTNIGNFVRFAGGWASVDWEHAGWGDAAFELADLMLHPAHQAVPPSRWLRVAEAYAACHHDEGLLARAEVYEVLLACWWAARFTRMSIGPEPARLSDLHLDPAGVLAGQRRYLVRAHELLDRFARPH